MKISALLATCSPTAVINSGSRHNKGVEGSKDAFVDRAFIVGLVGPRLHRLNVMEAQDLRILPQQNIQGSFYGPQSEDTMGKLFAKFYDLNHFPLYEEVDRLFKGEQVEGFKREQFVKGQHGEYFNKAVYEERVRISAELLLVEADRRAAREGKKAYVHIVGLGLGVWKLLSNQNTWYVDVFGKCLQRLELPNVSDIDFSWIGVNSVCGVENGQKIKNVLVHFSQRDPYENVDKQDEKIIVSSWAYDGNSYPGNEYWVGSLWTSGDPAAACSTQVPELHNPLINRKMSGSNAHVATKDGKIIPLYQFN